MLRDVCGLFLCFRVNSIAILLDVQKSFLQIGIQLIERDVTLFLWLRDATKPEIVTRNLDVYRFCCVHLDSFQVHSS